jgi:hypothetical protein
MPRPIVLMGLALVGMLVGAGRLDADYPNVPDTSPVGGGGAALDPSQDLPREQAPLPPALASWLTELDSRLLDDIRAAAKDDKMVQRYVDHEKKVTRLVFERIDGRTDLLAQMAKNARGK